MDLQITHSPRHTKEDAWRQFVEGSCSEAKGTPKSWQIRTQDWVRMPPSWRQNLWALLWALLTHGARTRPLPNSLSLPLRELEGLFGNAGAGHAAGVSDDHDGSMAVCPVVVRAAWSLPIALAQPPDLQISARLGQTRGAGSVPMPYIRPQAAEVAVPDDTNLATDLQASTRYGRGTRVQDGEAISECRTARGSSCYSSA
ncbi:uncharacterized protein PG986_010341 [Apiospora aurea]|uniref:Uncharacterized protein n=1 Tax=Apiospora aurea TaxID=335848 RepID=A0ABR1Q1Y3_9PEZI